MKDEALSNDANKFLAAPVPILKEADRASLREGVERCLDVTTTIRAADRDLADWLRVEMGLAKLSAALAQASRLNADGFVAAVRAALPKRQSLSPIRLRQLRDAFADVGEPARAARSAALGYERTLSQIVNRAYGLTEDDIALMWRTAPPRMPVSSAVDVVKVKETEPEG